MARVPALGAGCRRFKSCHLDQENKVSVWVPCFFINIKQDLNRRGRLLQILIWEKQSGGLFRRRLDFFKSPVTSTKKTRYPSGYLVLLYCKNLYELFLLFAYTNNITLRRNKNEGLYRRRRRYRKTFKGM